MSPAIPRLASLSFLALLACARPQDGTLRRRVLAPPPTSGWARVVLDGPAQRDAEGLWISDPAGRSVPFLRVGEALWAPQPLEAQHVVLGTDPQGRPTAEFELALPAGWQVGERTRLRVELDLRGEAPWVAAVEAVRQRPGGAFLTCDGPPERLYDLAPSGRQASLQLPWDGERFRLSLRMEQGRAPRIQGLKVWAETPAEAVSPLVEVPAALAPVAGQAGLWRIGLPAADRIVGLAVTLAPPAAPVRAEVRREGPDGAWLGSAMVWNLPALASRVERVDLPPTLAGTLLLQLPEGARPDAVRVRLRREALVFPAEAGQACVLHLGGQARPAPGDLGALPSSRILLAAAPLAAGPEAPDPDGVPRRVDAGTRARPWMPWVAGAAVLVLALAAWRLLRDGEASDR